MSAQSASLTTNIRGRRIGILGGTFDPIHNGHLAVAEYVKGFLDLDAVLFIPAKLPPHKRTQTVADFNHRLAMLKLAIGDRNDFFISTLEAQRPGPSYTYDTLLTLREQFGEQVRLFFMVGIDAFAEISSWKKFASLPDLADLVVVDREGADTSIFEQALLRLGSHFHYDRQTGQWHSNLTPGRIIPVNMPLVVISSTKIRQRLRKGEDISTYVPDAVCSYIRTRQIYVRE